MAGQSIFSDPADAQPLASPTAPRVLTQPRSLFSDPDEEEQGLRTTIQRAADTPPDTAARVLKLQLKTGLPPAVISRNLDQVERAAAAREFDPARFRAQSPHLAAWLQEDAQQAAVAQDDLEQLGALEWLFTAPGRAWRRGVAQVELGRLRSHSLFRELQASEHTRVAELRREVDAGGDLGAETWFGKALVGAAGQLPILFGAALEGARWGIPAGVTAGTGAAMLGQAGPQVLTPEEVVTVPAAFAGGMTAGLIAGGAEFGFQLEAGLAYDEYLEVEDELGQRIDPDVARGAALATGLVNGGLEAFGLQRFLRLFPGVGTLTGAFSRSAVREALRSPSVRSALGQAVKAYGGNLTLETSVEMAQRAVTILSGEVARVQSGVETQAPAAIAADVGREGISALQAFSLLSLPGPTMQAGVDVRAVRQARLNETFFAALGEGVTNSKTAQRLPEGMQRFVERATKDGPLSHFYAPVDTWTTYWQGKNVDPAAMAEQLTGDRDAYRRARESGEDLAIPAGRYAAKLAGTEHNTFFAQELRLAPDQPNTREAKALEAGVDAAAEQAEEAAPAGSPVRDAFQAELEATGFEPDQAEAYAVLHEHVFGSIGTRAGLGERALAQRFAIDVTRPDLEAAGEAGAPASLPASTAPAKETAVQRGARRTGQYAALTRAIVRDAQRQDPTVDVEALEQNIATRLALQEEQQEARIESGQDPGDLLRTVASYGGVWWERRSGAYKGEISDLIESGRDIRAVTKGGRVVHHRGRAKFRGVAGVFDEEGLTPDGMVEALQQDQRFQHITDINALIDALDEALRGKSAAVDVNRFPGTEDLPALGIRLGSRWWEGRGRREDAEAELVELEEQGVRDSVDTGEGDTSFEFAQGPIEAELQRDVALPEAVPVVSVASTESLEGLSAKDIRARAFAHAKGAATHLTTNQHTGWRVSVSSNGLKKSANYALRPEQLVALEHVDALLEQATYLRSEGDRRGHGLVYDYLYAPFEWAGELYVAKLAVRSGGGTDARTFYTLHAQKVERPAGVNADYTSTPAAEPPSPGGSTLSTPALLALVNEARETTELFQGPVPPPVRETGVVDEDGRELLGPGGFAGRRVGPGLEESPGQARAREIVEGVRQARAQQEAIDQARRDRAAAAAKPLVQTAADAVRRGVRELFQGGRGKVRFTPRQGDRRRFDIHLFQDADLSTLLHELGHTYLVILGDVVEDLLRVDVAERSATQQQLVADYGAILEYVGARPGAELTVEQNERFARAFETYLFEGTAPSAELRSAFARFAAWLKGIYRSILRLDAPLNDEIRAVFDRLVATDDAIAAARAEAQIVPLFTDAQSAGMTELEFASYADEVRDAHAREEEELRARVLSELRREEFAWWKREREQLEAAVTEELQEQPVYRALAVMRTGAYPDGTPFVEGEAPTPIKISRESLVAEFGASILRRLPRPYLYAANSGISPDAAAELFGFASGDELLKAIIAAPAFRKAVDAEVDRRMQAKHGDVFAEGRLAEEAKQVVQGGEHRQRIVEAELRALTRGMVRATIPSAATINAAAQRRIAAMRVRDIRPGLFLQASRRASQRAFSLLSTGQDRAGAVRAKLQEAVNLALYREARDAQTRVDVMRRRLQAYRQPAARRRFGTAGGAYLQQIDALLDRYELAAVPLVELERRKSLGEFVTQLEGEDMPVSIPRELLDESRRVNYQDVPLEEFTGVHDAVEHLARLVRLKNELLKAERRRTFEEARDALVDGIRLNNAPRAPTLEIRPEEERLRTVGEWFAAHTKIAIHARALDGFADGGEMWEQIIRPINAAVDAEQAQRSAAIDRMNALFRKHYAGRELLALNRKSHIPAIGASLSKEARLMVALNWGNDGNRDRLLNDPVRRWNLAQIHAILETLDARDWAFVQDVFDFVDSFWPEIEAKQRRVVGLPPEKVQASPIDTKFGQFRGGYFPIKGDGRLVARAGVLQEAGEATLKTFAAYVQATTRRGHLEARTEHATTAVRLDFSVLFNHVDQVIHDLTHHEMLIDVSRLLKDEEVARAIYETRGDEAYRQFVKALGAIADGNKPATNILERAANFARGGTQIALLGLNFWTMVQQPLGLFNGMQRVGPTWVLRGMTRWLRDTATMESTVAWIYARSAFMKERANTATQDLADLRASLSRPGWFDGLVRTVTADTVTQQNIVNSFLWHIGQAQKLADVPTWLGAYEKAMAEFNDEARAAALADQAVIDSQGSGRISDLAEVQRGGPIAKLFMTFYTYGSTVFNQTVEAYGRTTPSLRRPGSVAAFLGHLSLIYAMPALGTVMLSRAFGRTGDDDDDAGDWAREFAKENLSAAMNAVVGLREMSGIVDAVLGGGEGAVRGYAGPAGARVFQTAYRAAAEAAQGRLDEGLARSINSLAGILFRYPAAQVGRTVDGFVALTEGRTRNPAALLVGGPRR